MNAAISKLLIKKEEEGKTASHTFHIPMDVILFSHAFMQIAVVVWLLQPRTGFANVNSEHATTWSVLVHGWFNVRQMMLKNESSRWR